MAKYKVPTIQEMLDAGVHFGHQVRRWHPKMEPYIYIAAKDIHIIDLEQSEKMLGKACEFLFEAAKEGKKVVFVGTKKQSRDIIELEAKRCGAMYVKERWVGGTITNFPFIKKNLDKLIKYMKDREEGNFVKYTKKERLLIDRSIDKMNSSYGGIISMRATPDVLFVIDPKREKTAIREAKNSHIPVVAIVDTNADPTTVNYPIPGNDDAIKSIALLVKAVADAIEEGYKEFGKIKEAALAAKEPAKVVEKIAAAPAVITGTESPVVTEVVNKKDEKILEEVAVKDAVVAADKVAPAKTETADKKKPAAKAKKA